MLKSSVKFNKEIKTFIKNRRIRLLLTMYRLCIIMFIALIIVDLCRNNIITVILEVISLILITSSFFLFYKHNQYDMASYSIISILGIGIIAGLVVNEFNNYLPVYCIPFLLGAFFLFSWKRGIIINIIFFVSLFFVAINMKDNFIESTFLQNYTAIGNLLVIIIIIFVFAYYYETTRVDAYKLLIDLNYKKELLYRELQHRVKNNLNIVSSMLAMQAQRESKEIKEIIEISKKRIDSMAMVHSMLYVSDNIERVDVKAFLENLSQNLKKTSNENIDIKLKIKELELPLNEIIPIGLIINELLTNSFKYAFQNTHNPKITLVFKTYKGNAFLTYHDNGSGYSSEKVDNMGLKLVELNVKQLKGSLKIREHNGLGYKIVYKRGLNV